MNYFFKKEIKKIHKASETVKSPNKRDIKSATDKHSKTASNFKTYKTIKYNFSRTGNCRKPNILEMESVTIEHPKTVTKLWTPIKQPKKKSNKWCLVRYLNPVNKNPAKIRNVDRELAKQLNFKGVKFPIYKKEYAKKEKQNNIFINVFGPQDEIPYLIYTSKETFEKHVDLLLLSNSKNSHYVLIKDFNRFMTSKTMLLAQKY